MRETQRRKWNDDKLNELYPPFKDKICDVIMELESCGCRPRIQDGWRSEMDQLKAFNSGHSQLKYGFHNVTGEGGRKESLAVDIVDDDIINKKKTTYEYAEFLLRLTAASQKRGLITGIEWGLENFPGAIQAIAFAITNGDWKAPLKHFGWDPGHVQPRGLSPDPDGLTPDDVRSGKRPF
jgi:hypothetical protein